MRSQIALFGFAFLVLFYWFRHKCGSTLRKYSRPERAEQVAAANHLRFPSIAETVDSMLPDEIHAADRTLVREYNVILCLLRYVSPGGKRRFTLAERLLMIDFAMLSRWYALTRRRLPGQARCTISERAQILICLSSAISQRAVSVLGI